MAAALGALPLVITTGPGSELRRPLGITIIGGLLVSQALIQSTATAPVLDSTCTSAAKIAKIGGHRRPLASGLNAHPIRV